tara:strand:- start:551 stop:724 length:174 start_codon:yes stop_codon:yes gene_type:complete
MMTLKLYQDEANAIERILDLILTDEGAAKAVFRDGAERRSVGRVSKKLGWARSADAA